MANIAQQTPYQCDQCGCSDFIAAPVLYQQGTRTYSGMFRWGTSQTRSAQLATPPRPRSYAGPFLRWGFPLCFCFFWGLTVLTTIFQRSQATTKTTVADVSLLLLGIVCLGGLIRSLRKVADYNRNSYTQLLRDWEHTFTCRRCGSSRLVLS